MKHLVEFRTVVAVETDNEDEHQILEEAKDIVSSYAPDDFDYDFVEEAENEPGTVIDDIGPWDINKAKQVLNHHTHTQWRPYPEQKPERTGYYIIRQHNPLHATEAVECYFYNGTDAFPWGNVKWFCEIPK